MRTRKILIAIIVMLSVAKQLDAQYVQPFRYPHNSFTEQVNIGVGVARVTNPNAYLEVGPVTAANKGMLPPRLSTTERDAIAVTVDSYGLFIFNKTTGKLNVYNSTGWGEVAGGTVYIDTAYSRNDSLLYKKNGVEYFVKRLQPYGSYQSTLTFPYSVVAPGNAIQLDGDEASPGNNEAYATSASGVKGFRPIAVINTASRDSSDHLEWNGTEHVYVPKTSGAANLLGILKFQVSVTTNAPIIGATTLTNTGLINKKIMVFREGGYQDSSATDGYTFNKTTGVITFPVPLADSERVYVHVYDTTSIYHIALQAAAVDSFLLGNSSVAAVVSRAYSLRKLRSGQVNAVQVQRLSDNTLTNIGFSGVDFDEAAYTTAEGASNCLMKTWYDQTTNAQNATAPAPLTQLVDFELGNTVGTRPGVYFSGLASYLDYPETFSGTGAKAVFIVYKNLKTGTYSTTLVSQSTGTTTGTWWAVQSRTSGATGSPYFTGYAADLTDGVADDNTGRLAAMLYDGTTGYLRKNGAQIATGALSLNTTASNPFIGKDSGGSLFEGYICEIIMCNTNAASVLATIEANINAYYAIY